MEHFQQLNFEKDIAFVIVTHDEEIAAFANCIVRMKDGQIFENLLVESSSDVEFN
jgi:ABC-type lipoprotein export system ATPase subunit